MDFFNQINMLYGTITEFCTPQACPVMSAGPKYATNALTHSLSRCLLVYNTCTRNTHMWTHHSHQHSPRSTHPHANRTHTCNMQHASTRFYADAYDPTKLTGHAANTLRTIVLCDGKHARRHHHPYTHTLLGTNIIGLTEQQLRKRLK